MPITGEGVKDRNVAYRVCMFLFAGLMAFAILISWRSQLLFTSDYTETMYKHPVKPNAIHYHHDQVQKNLTEQNTN